ncbi:MAG: DUF4388 domain-containing protein [Actinobacteria bacterium]|nr:DUF4388 domain-containing protein [Actinomycetota bacterium]
MLEGDLSEFNFGEILKLAGKNRKTGVIILRKPDGSETSVYLKDGYIYFAESNTKKKPIGEMLIESGKISRAQLQEALEEQKRIGKKVRLGMILLDKGFINPQDLVSVVQEQIMESIFRLFEWNEGTFIFIPNKIAENEDIGIKLDIDTAILKGAEKISHWKSLKRFVGSMDSVFEPAEVTDEDRVIVLKPRELKVLRLVDGERKIRDILKASGMTEVELYSILFALSSAGLIRKKEESTD